MQAKQKTIYQYVRISQDDTEIVTNESKRMAPPHPRG